MDGKNSTFAYRLLLLPGTQDFREYPLFYVAKN